MKFISLGALFLLRDTIEATKKPWAARYGDYGILYSYIKT
jgi:hypothetical protein